jgi:hypothetical protein
MIRDKETSRKTPICIVTWCDGLHRQAHSVARAWASCALHPSSQRGPQRNQGSGTGLARHGIYPR